MTEKQPTLAASMVVNDATVPFDPDCRSSLLMFLRNDLHLSGTKAGCASGDCGACTVLVDNTATQACQISLAAAAQCDIQTIEHIVQTPLGKRISSALVRQQAAQCGYCLPGIVVTVYAELQTVDTPDLIQALRQNLCRCGSHSRILTALREVLTTTEA